MRSAIRYSEAFKLQVLRELEEGRFESRAAAARAYGIRGMGSIEYWAKKYGKLHLLGKVIRVETPKEVSEVKELRKRVRDLEKALADALLHAQDIAVTPVKQMPSWLNAHFASVTSIMAQPVLSG